MNLIQRVNQFFKELSSLGIFDQISGLSDATHPDQINQLCDDVQTAANNQPTLYTLQMWGCTDPNLYGPYDTQEDRLKARIDFEPNIEHCYCKLDIDQFGTPTVYPFTNVEIEDDEDDDPIGPDGQDTQPFIPKSDI